MSQKKQANYRGGWSLEKRDPEFIRSLMPFLEWLYKYYFRVQSDGWHHIPENERVLIVGSHNGGTAAPDMLMMMYDWFRRFGVDRLAYGLAHRYAWQSSEVIATLAEKVGAIEAHPKMALAAFKKGANVLVYPGGQYDMFRPHNLRDRIYFAGQKGFIKLALRQRVPIVPVISVGAHDTLIILGDYYQEAKQIHQNLGLPWLFGLDPGVFPIYLGLPWGISVGPLPNIPFPLQIHTRVCRPIEFDRYGRDAAKDREYVDACYRLVYTQMQQELDRLIRETA